MKKYLLLVTLFLPVFLSAQTTGNLTVFSEDGDKFFLVLNGEKQNEVAQTNIRIEELPQPYYNAKVIFADSSIGSVSKNNLILTDHTGAMMDVTYKIKKDKSRKAKLNAYSAIPVQRDFVVPTGVYVRRFGQPAGTNNGTIQTTTTTTTSNSVNANVNMPGINMNVTINDPGETYSTTTTTSTSSSQPSSNQNEAASGNTCRGWAMKSTDFTAAKKTIADASFEDTKLSTAKSITSANCLSVDQVSAICNLFNFEDTKLQFAKHAYKYTIDPKNYFKVSNVFTFDASKEELSKFITE